MAFYHGTSSVAGLRDVILPPCHHNFGVNEVGRVKHENKVFFTTVKGYAEAYARRACKRVGGIPIVYEILSAKPKLMSKAKGCDVYYDNRAIILEEVNNE